MKSVKLEIQHAALGYRDNQILQTVNLELSTEKTTCLLGKNGSGKTTLFKSLLGIIPVLSGKILLNEKDITQWNRNKLAQVIAYIPQARSLPFPFTVLEVVLFGRTAYLNTFSSPGKKDKFIAEECLERLNISFLKDKIFTQLSGGEQQMVIIARALAQQPSFLIMDEPTSNLDFGNQIKIIQQVNDLRNDHLGIFMATHSPDHAFMCNADVILIHDHKIWKKGSCDEVLTSDTLKKIYGVDIDIQSISQNGHLRKICIPNYINQKQYKNEK